jgi:hypothetical protein
MKPAKNQNPGTMKSAAYPMPLPSPSQPVPVATPRTIRDLGKNESWLQQQIFENPSILGLGDLHPVRRERSQPSGGRLDLLLVDPTNDNMYEVEVMLGESDESHIIRTIEYWHAESRLFPQRKHTAVLVAERINSRFSNVIHLFSRSIPIIGIQCNAIELAGQTGLHFTSIIDSFEEPEVELPEESSPADEQSWVESHPDQTAFARKLAEFAADRFEEVELRFGNQYMAIRAGRYDRIKMYDRKRGFTLVSYRLEPSEMERAIAECYAAGIEPNQKAKNELQFLTDLKSFQKHPELHSKLMQWITKRDLQLKLAHPSSACSS